MIIAQRTKLNNLMNQESKLKEDIKALKWQISSLSAFSSVHQIRAWKQNKRHLTIRLNIVKGEIRNLEARIRGAAWADLFKWVNWSLWYEGESHAWRTKVSDWTLSAHSFFSSEWCEAEISRPSAYREDDYQLHLSLTTVRTWQKQKSRSWTRT